MKTVVKDGLRAPETYFSLLFDDKKRICNGVGAKDHWTAILPESIMGASINESANIHDYMVYFAQREEDYDLADLVFGRNMRQQITDQSSNMFTCFIRLVIADAYYVAVRFKGVYRNRKSNSL